MRMYLLDVFRNTSGDAAANPANFFSFFLGTELDQFVVLRPRICSLRYNTKFHIHSQCPPPPCEAWGGGPLEGVGCTRQ